MAGGRFEISFLHEFILRMCDEDRTGADEERFAPVGHVRNVRSKPNDLSRKSLDLMKFHRLTARKNLDLAAAANCAF